MNEQDKRNYPVTPKWLADLIGEYGCAGGREPNFESPAAWSMLVKGINRFVREAIDEDRTTRALPAGAAPSGWLPIEGAPRTSNSILVYCPDRSNTYLVTWDRLDESWRLFGGMDTLTEDPSHWMPRPQSPYA